MRALPLILVLALLGGLYLQWREWPPEPQMLGSAPETESADAGRAIGLAPELLARVESLEDKMAYAEVIERPLFLPDRRPAEEEATEPTEMLDAEATPLERLDLTAVIMTVDSTTAWVLDRQSRELIKVRQGEDVAGWTVREIRADRLVLERQGVTDTLQLRTFSSPSVAMGPRRSAGTPRPSPRPASHRAARRTAPSASVRQQ